MNPKVKKKASVKKQTVMTDDEECEDLIDPEIDSESPSVELESEVEYNSELERLRQRLAELEKVSRNPPMQTNAEPTVRQKSDSPQKRCKPSEGRSLGTYNGKTDLDTFLVRLETCSRYFDWSESEKVFHLMNSLTESASLIVKEVGPGGTLEQILELLQVRFGNRAKKAKFLTDLQNRKRRPNESLQELYLDLCELRANAFGDDPSERYPEIYFRNIFVDALNDKALRRSILVQKPGTMEAAYNIAVELKVIDAYPTPVADPSRVKPKFRQIGRELADSPEFLKETEKQIQVVGNQRLAELEELMRAQNAAIEEMRQITESLRHKSSQTISHPMQNPGSEESGDQPYGGGPVNNYRESSVPSNVEVNRSARPSQRRCYNCDEYGHFSRYCEKSRRRDENWRSPRNDGSRSRKNSARKCGSVPGTMSDKNLQSKLRREAYLEIQLGTKKILALLDSGCEQSVIGRNLIRKIPLEPTREKLSTADGTDVPLLGETTIEFLVSGFQTKCRVVVSEVIDELILGIEWLQTNQCVWDFGSNSFAIEGHKGRLRCKKTSKSVRRILVQDEIEIPGWHTQEVPVLISRSSLNNEKLNWGLSSKMTDPDILIASAIYDSDKIQSVCRIMNMSDLPKRLKKGSELGEVEPVKLMEFDKQTEFKSRKVEVEEAPLDLRRITGSESSCRTESAKETSATDSRSGPTTSMKPESADFIKEMFDKIALDLTEDQRQQVEELLQENKEIFSTSEFDLGRTNLVRHTIDTGTNRPFKLPLRHVIDQISVKTDLQ